MSRTTAHILKQLERYESRNVTYIDPKGGWPIVWERARGVYVWDVEGRRYLDFTSAFGVASTGHCNRAVVSAASTQARTLLHAMGDVHPHAAKAKLCRELSRLTFERWGLGSGKTLLGNSGFEAVEAALKTALLATRKKGVVAFHGGYHGLGYGALNATHREFFRKNFLQQLGGFGHFVPFPKTAAELEKTCQLLRKILKTRAIGAVLVEPIQGRGGLNVAADGFLPLLRNECDRHKAVLIFDEIFTGFGKTGKWFACENSGVYPDIICLGKALTGGFPLSACVGRSVLMDKAWPPSHGEALHTSTFLGHPAGCAMALAQMREVERLLPKVTLLGEKVRQYAGQIKSSLQMEFRGKGLMAGIAFFDGQKPAGDFVVHLVKRLLTQGILCLPEGDEGNVLALIPPFTISAAQLKKGMEIIRKEIESAS